MIKLMRPYLVVIAVCLLTVGVSIQLMRMQDLKWGGMFADPSDIGGYPIHTGLFTYIGVLALTIAAAVLAFSALRMAPVARDEVIARRVLVVAALLSALLAIDDLWQFHERVLRHAFGIHEALVYAVFAVIGLVILLIAGRRSLSAQFTGFWIAAGLLVVSLIADLLEDKANPSAIQLLAEEVTKLCGLTVWMLFWWRFAATALDRNIGRVARTTPAIATSPVRCGPSPGDCTAQTTGPAITSTTTAA